MIFVGFLFFFTSFTLSTKAHQWYPILKLVGISNIIWFLRLVTQHRVQMKYEENASNRDQTQVQK